MSEKKHKIKDNLSTTSSLLDKHTFYSTDKFFVSQSEKFLRAKLDAVSIIPAAWQNPIITEYKGHINKANEEVEHVNTLEDVILHAYKYRRIAKHYLDLFDSNDDVLQFILNFFIEHAVLTVRRAFDWYMETQVKLDIGGLIKEIDFTNLKVLKETEEAISKLEQRIEKSIRRKLDMLYEMGLVDRERIATKEDKEKSLVSKGMPETNAYVAPWVQKEDRKWIYLFYSKSIGFEQKTKEEKIAELTEIYTDAKINSSKNLMEYYSQDGEGSKLKKQLQQQKIPENTNQIIFDKHGKKKCKICYEVTYKKEKEKNPKFNETTWETIWYLYPTIRSFAECSLHNEGRV